MTPTAARRSAEFRRRFKVAAHTAKWAVTMTKVCIRQAVARAPFPRWHLLTFSGPGGGESTGVVDMIAVRKDHGAPPPGSKRGDLLQMILIQVKGGSAARPTAEDAKRLRIVARRHRACGVLLATWKRGSAVKFFSLRDRSEEGSKDWVEVSDLKSVFVRDGKNRRAKRNSEPM